MRVFEDHLFAAVFFTFKLGDHGGSIVTAAFCGASTAFTSASILRGQPNVHRLWGAKVVTGRRPNHMIFHVTSRANPQICLGRNHKRTEVKRLSLTVGNPFFVCLYQLLQGLDKGLFGQLRQRHTMRRAVQARRVLLGSECPH